MQLESGFANCMQTFVLTGFVNRSLEAGRTLPIVMAQGAKGGGISIVMVKSTILNRPWGVVRCLDHKEGIDWE